MFKMSLKYLREDDIPWTNALLYVSCILITLGEKPTHSLSDNSLCPKKLELIKQEMARVNIDSLDISELKWTGMVEFNSDGYCIYYCGQESLRRNGVPLTVNKRVWNAVFGCNLKNYSMISVHFQGKPFSITVIEVFAPTTTAEEAEVAWYFEDLQDFVELTPKKTSFSS